MSSSVAMIPREERIRKFGVDCADKLVWDRWVPGGEYLKSLVLTNLQPKLQVLQYKAPKFKAIYFMSFPEPITLTAGMQHSIEIRFRPSEMREYIDYLEIVTPQGSFWIELAAFVPYTSIEVPPKYDFNFCPVNVVSDTTLEIKNTGTLRIDYKWEVLPPFSITPDQGVLEPKSSQTIKVFFRPTEATALVATAVIRANDQSHLMKLSGIGKYPYISCPDTVVDFGTVLTGLRVEKTVVISNKSLVDATFAIKRTDTDLENPFHFYPSSGLIPKESSMKIKITYRPMTSGMAYSNDFVARTPGGNELRWRLYSESANPDAYLSVNSINFGDIDLDSGSQPEKVVVLTNPSVNSIEYCFSLVDAPGGAFYVHPSQGTISAQKSANITVRFQPRECINYYRRLYCTVSNQTYLLHLDIIGTGYSKNARPPPFSMAHVVAFRARCAYGLAALSPDDLERLTTAMKDNQPPADRGEEAARMVIKKSLEGVDPTVGPKALFQAYFTSVKSTQNTPFCLDQDMVEFTGRGEPHVVQVKNLTASKVTATWCVPKTDPPSWSMEPPSQDIGPFGSGMFTIRCLRGGSTANTLECYVYYKTMRSFRLATENNYCPPVCLPLFCINPSRADGTVAAALTLGRKHIAFPSCHRGDAVVQCVTLTNNGDTAVQYRWTIEGLAMQNATPEDEQVSPNDIFMIKPAFGVVAAKSCQLVSMRFSPQRDTRYFAIAKAMLNNSTNQFIGVKLLGEAYVANVTLPNNASVYFRPAAVGCCTYRTYTIENPSRIPVRYEWQVPDKWKDIFIISPLVGNIKGNGTADISFTFKPDKERQIIGHIPLLVTPASDEGIDHAKLSKTRQSVSCVGEGCFGGLTMEPSVLNFNTIVVGEHITKEITLFNSSLCDMAFLLQIKFHDPTPEGVITFNTKQGVMRARSHETIRITFTPKERRVHNMIVYCLFGDKAVEENDGREISTDDLYKLPNCTVSARGEYAMLQVVDIRSLFISKAHLWEQFCIADLNNILASDIVDCDVETDNFSFKQVLAVVPKCVMDMAVDIVATPPTKVIVCFENPTNSDVEFKFWLPDESEIVSEKWYHEEAPDQEDLNREQILDNKIFTIEPLSGVVAPGTRINIVMCFQHKIQGVHELPVILQLNRGKRIALGLRGTTLTPSDRMLFITRSVHEFQPVAIGDMDPLLQYFELRNLSHQSVQYELDYKALKNMRDQNFDFPIFQCLNAYGTIPPVSSVMLRWYFRPLEAKIYELVVPITVHGGKSYEVLFRGQGYHPKHVLPEDLQHMERTEFLNFPRLPHIVDVNVPVSLSLDTITFGRIPCHSLHRSFLILSNSHAKDAFAFEWFATIHSGDQIIEIEPNMGTVGPGQRVVCKITLYAGSTIHLVDCNIQCHVVNDDLRSRRLAAREALEYENKMRLDAPTAPTATSEVGKATKQRVPVTTIPAKYQTTMRLKRRLQQLMESVDVGELDENSEDLIYVDVLPIALDLRLQFRVMPLDSYRSLYPDLHPTLMLPTIGVYSQHIDPIPPLPQTDATFEELQYQLDRDVPVFSEDVRAGEKLLVAEVLQDIVRSLIHDPAIDEALEEAVEEDVPLYDDYVHLAEPVRPTVVSSSDDHILSLLSHRQEEHETASIRALMQNGEVQALMEEVMDSLLYGLLNDAATGKSGAPASQMLCGGETTKDKMSKK